MDKKKVQKLQDWSENKHKEFQDHVVNDTGVTYGMKHKNESAGKELLAKSAIEMNKIKDTTPDNIDGKIGSKKKVIVGNMNKILKVKPLEDDMSLPINKINEGSSNVYED
jgi:hypothetical protein